jgi:hypothetical protein
MCSPLFAGPLSRQLWRMHQPIPVQGKWQQQVFSGYFNYHAVPTNSRAFYAFRHFVAEIWQRSLRRRSQKYSTTWERFTQLANDWLPKPTILHPWPERRFAVKTPKVGAVCLNRARTVLCGGRSVMSVPTAIQARQNLNIYGCRSPSRKYAKQIKIICVASAWQTTRAPYCWLAWLAAEQARWRSMADWALRASRITTA